MKTEMHPEKIQNQKWKGWLSEMETKLRLQRNHNSKANSKKNEEHIIFFLLHHMRWFLEVLAFATSNRMKLIVSKREKLIKTGPTVCYCLWKLVELKGANKGAYSRPCHAASYALTFLSLQS